MLKISLDLFLSTLWSLEFFIYERSCGIENFKYISDE